MGREHSAKLVVGMEIVLTCADTRIDMAVAEGLEPSSWCWSQSKNSPELPIDMLWHTLRLR